MRSSRRVLSSLVTIAVSLPFCVAAIVESVNDLSAKSFDFIVVGGGTAGNVVASRLSENPNYSVLVLEAGGSHEGIEELEIPFYCSRLTPYTVWDWNYTTTPQAALNGKTFPFQRGYVLGGSSSVNTMTYARGTAEDYDRFAKVTGDSSWSWKGLQKYFQLNERWTAPADGHNTTGQYDPSVHGYKGAMAVSLSGYPMQTDSKILNAAAELGGEFAYNLDLNSGNPLGIGWSPATIKNGSRDSSATAYLSQNVLARPNLQVLVHAQVTRILPSPSSGTASKPTFKTVEFVKSGTTGPTTLLTAKKEIILAAGVVGSPFILLHSGIGNATELQSLGIKPLVNLPSVGRNLSDHAVVPTAWPVNNTDTIETWVRDPAFVASALAEWRANKTGPYVDIPLVQLGWVRVPDEGGALAAKGGDPAAGPNTPHVELIISNGIAGKTIPPTGNTFVVATTLVTPASRGSLVLNSSSPFDHPIIDPGYLSSPIDMFLMRGAVRAGRRFAQAPTIQAYVSGPPYYGDPTTDDATLDAFIRSNGTNQHHPVGTAGMSAKGASYGVVDPDLKLKGVDGVRIVDSSIFPFIPSAHTQVATYIVGEKGADMIKSSW